MQPSGFYVVPGTDRRAACAHYFLEGKRVSLCGVQCAGELESWKANRTGDGRMLPASSPVCERCQDLNDARWAGLAQQPAGV